MGQPRDGEVRVCVLGPVELWLRGRRTAWGPPLCRATLALLALADGRVVPATDLVDGLWGEDPPPSARKNVQAHISALRRVLGERLVTRAPGYVLTLLPGEIDLGEFERLAADAVSAAGGGDLDRAAGAYRAALEVWRGPPLADVAAIGGLGRHADALDSRRMVVQSAWIETELTLGRTADLLPVLEGLVAAHPLDEQLREQHIRALAAEGHRAEAWHSYVAARSLLHAELGVEPSEPLQAAAEAALERGASPATVVARPVPEPIRLLPAASTTFTGRTDAVERLAGWLRSDRVRNVPRVCVVSGVAGIGKSAVAVRAAHEVAELYPDGQVAVDLRGGASGDEPLSPYEACVRVLRAIGVPSGLVPRDVDEAAEHWRSWVAGRRVLLLLDDAADAVAARFLTPPDGGSALVVTSRHALAELAEADHLELGPMTAAEATELLASVAGPARIDAASRDLADVLGWLGGLPLALKIVGARLAARPQWTVRTLRRRLAVEHRRLDELALGDIAVRSSLLMSIEAIESPRAQQLFRRLGLLDAPHVVVPVAAALLDVSRADVRPVLDELAEANLIEEVYPDRYRLHELVRVLARELAIERDPAAVRAAAIDRAVRAYLAGAHRAVGALRVELPSGPEDAPEVRAVARRHRIARGWLEDERPNLIAAVRHASSRLEPGDAARAVELALLLAEHFRGAGDVGAWMTVDRLARAAARRHGDRAAEALVLRDLAIAHDRVHQLEDAAGCLRDSLAIALELGDRLGVAYVRNALGINATERGDWTVAATEFAASARLRRSLGDLHGEAATLSNRGAMLALSGRHDASVRSYRAALRAARTAGSRGIEANVLCNLGDVYCRLGRPADAIDVLESSIVIYQARAERGATAAPLANLADAHHALGHSALALRLAAAAVTQYRNAGSSWGEATALRRLASFEREVGRVRHAETHLRRAISVFARIDPAEAAATEALEHPVPAGARGGGERRA